MSLGVCARAHSALEVKFGVNKGQVPIFSAPLKMTISQPRRGLSEVCKGLEPFSRPVLFDRTTIRNFIPPQPQFESIRKLLVLTKLELFLGGDSFTKVVIHDPWNTVASLSEGQIGSRAFYFGDIY